ncbi:hypothetical protein FH972_006651 [Carpinus fangiana]|uniref:Pectinesterase inhibitor domain-containing protein n=1 Tax=Carpinus fangiana TaxID=176857 RepID=A0A5N6QTZ6_9ROSI|nr:hypothetical protein FH972_006651 [Carpinus fangiana]
MNAISCSKVFLVLLVTLLPNQILADQKLIASACDKTLYKQLCTKTLQKDPEGRKATTSEALSKVALKHATSAATQIHDQVISLLKRSSGNKQALKDCKENYEDALYQLGRSTTALASKRYNDVNTWVSAAMSDADSCDEGFNDVRAKNPLGSEGTTFSHLCSIVLAITNQLK